MYAKKWNIILLSERGDFLAYNKFNKTLSKGLKILEIFTAINPSFSLMEISKITGMSKSTVFRFSKTLCELNYLKYDPQRKIYFLGPKILSLGFSLLASMGIREIARPFLKKLSQECHKTVSLAILDGTEMVYVERVKNPSDLWDFNLNIASRIDIYNTAIGRALLAYLDPDRLKGILTVLNKDPKAVPYLGKRGEKLINILNKIRKNGYSIVDGERIKGIRAIGVPIFTPEGVHCAINLISGIEISVSELINDYAPRLIKAGAEISKATGASMEAFAKISKPIA